MNYDFDKCIQCNKIMFDGVGFCSRECYENFLKYGVDKNE